MHAWISSLVVRDVGLKLRIGDRSGWLWWGVSLPSEARYTKDTKGTLLDNSYVRLRESKQLWSSQRTVGGYACPEFQRYPLLLVVSQVVRSSETPISCRSGGVRQAEAGRQTTYAAAHPRRRLKSRGKKVLLKPGLAHFSVS